MMAGEERVVSASMKTKLQARASRILPDSAKAQMHRGTAEPGSASPTSAYKIETKAPPSANASHEQGQS
jgi:hypothetical protein